MGVANEVSRKEEVFRDKLPSGAPGSYMCDSYKLSTQVFGKMGRSSCSLPLYFPGCFPDKVLKKRLTSIILRSKSIHLNSVCFILRLIF